MPLKNEKRVGPLLPQNISGFNEQDPTCAETTRLLFETKKAANLFENTTQLCLSHPEHLTAAEEQRLKLQEAVETLKKTIDIYQFEKRKKIAREHSYEYVTRSLSTGACAAKIKQGGWLLVDEFGGRLSSESYDAVFLSAVDDVFWVKAGVQWFLCGPDGKKRTKNGVDLKFEENTALKAPYLVCENLEFYYVDSEGKKIGEHTFSEANFFSEGRAFAKMRSYNGIMDVSVVINEQGRVVFTLDEIDSQIAVFPPSEKRYRQEFAMVFAVESGVDQEHDVRRFMVIDRDGKVVGKKFSEMYSSDFMDGVSPICQSQHVFFGRNEKTQKWSIYDLGLNKVSGLSFYDYKTGKQGIFSENLACVAVVEDEYFYITNEGKRAFEKSVVRVNGVQKEITAFDKASLFSEGVAWVMHEGSWYAIDKQGEEIFSLPENQSISSASSFSDGVAFVKFRGKKNFSLIDMNGKKISNKFFSHQRYFQKGVMFNSYTHEPAIRLFDNQGSPVGNDRFAVNSNEFSDEGVAYVVGHSSGLYPGEAYYIDYNGERVF